MDVAGLRYIGTGRQCVYVLDVEDPVRGDRSSDSLFRLLPMHGINGLHHEDAIDDVTRLMNILSIYPGIKMP